MARKPRSTKVEPGDADKVSAWLAKNEIKVIPRNQGGEVVVKGFLARRKKLPFKLADTPHIDQQYEIDQAPKAVDKDDAPWMGDTD